uniref:Uncharacterized protein n=1 Tax=Anguilla anguilla TaxID=7936 RepID=A0A0E9WD72_ANGAN
MVYPLAADEIVLDSEDEQLPFQSPSLHDYITTKLHRYSVSVWSLA